MLNVFEVPRRIVELIPSPLARRRPRKKSTLSSTVSYIRADNFYATQQRSNKLCTTECPSNVSREHQSPALTMSALPSISTIGGETTQTSPVAADETLSEPIEKPLQGLRAEHDRIPAG